MFGADGYTSIGGALTKFGTDLASNYLTSEHAAKLQRENMDYQDKLQRAYVQDQYGLQKEGLIQAGYNPLLALGQSAANEGISVGAAANGQAMGFDPFEKVLNAKNVNAQIRDLANQGKNRDEHTENETATTVANIRNTTNVANADIGLKNAMTTQQISNNMKTLAELELLGKQLKNYGADRMHRLAQGWIKTISGAVADVMPGVKIKTSSGAHETPWGDMHHFTKEKSFGW